MWGEQMQHSFAECDDGDSACLIQKDQSSGRLVEVMFQNGRALVGLAVGNETSRQGSPSVLNDVETKIQCQEMRSS